MKQNKIIQENLIRQLSHIKLTLKELHYNNELARSSGVSYSEIVSRELMDIMDKVDKLIIDKLIINNKEHE